MSEDTRLDAFEEKREASATAAEDEREAEAEAVDVTSPESTYAFSSDGAACASCGESVMRRFRSEDGLVCADCKPWRV